MTQCPGQDKRFWKPEDIYEVNCPKCQAKVEFWKDDVYRRCKNCTHKFRNPKLDIGCAEWCEYANSCLGQDLEKIKKELKEKEGKVMTKTLTKSKRNIIKIDEGKCTGCGDCIPNCPEGALQIIDDKARLVSDLFCDGLGACIGHCPEGAISIEEREAEPYDERKVMANIIKQGENTIKAHLKHLKEHNQCEYLKQAVDFLNEKGLNVSVEEPKDAEHKLPCGCPGTAMKSFAPKKEKATSSARMESQLTQWPVQLKLVPPTAPFLQSRDLVIAADCVSYAYANFHQDFLKDKALVIACPKLDDNEYYLDKLTRMFKLSDIKSIAVLHMEVPCCFGLVQIVEEALKRSGKKIPFKTVVIGVQGEVKARE